MTSGEEPAVDLEVGGHDRVFALRGVGVFQTDVHTGRVTRANGTFCQLLGYTETDVQGLSYGELTRDPAAELPDETSLQHFWAKDGSVRLLELHTTVFPVTESAGESGAYTLSVVYDLTTREVTRHKVEADLRRSEARYQTLFNSVDEGFCLIELLFDEAAKPVDYRFLEMNGAFERQTGLSRAVGKTALELVPDLEPFWFEMYGKVALTGEPVRFVDEAKAMKRWFDVFAFRPEGEQIVAVLFTDVTERKQAETVLKDFNAALEQQVETRTAELRKSEARFLQAFSAGPVAACIVTVEAETLLEVNDAFTQLTGYNRGEALGKTHTELGLWSSPLDREKLAAAAAAGPVRNLELNLLTAHGDTRDILLSSEMMRLEDRDVHLRMFFDVTQRKEAETWRELLGQAMDSAEEAVVITDAELAAPGPHIVYVNAAFTAMMGYTATEVLGRSPRMFQGPRSDRAVLRRMRRRLRIGSSFEGETVNYRKNGDDFILAWSVAPIRDAAGRVTHYVSTQHDVTERRALERELLELSARQQQRVADELHDTVQQQLIGTALQTKRLVEKAASLPPELGAEFVSELRELYGLIQDSVKGVRTVLGDVTPVQETENGLLVALTSMCERVSRLFQVPCMFAFEQPLLVRDSARATNLFYIVQEACLNAARHAHASRVDVRLAGTGMHYTLSVTDDGKGIAEETLQQGSPGLELMAYRAKLLGAAFEISPGPDRGTTVSLSFDK